jgi:hypothetical protein
MHLYVYVLIMNIYTQICTYNLNRIWEKWSMFDESTRVPLMIAHPMSPFKGTYVYLNFCVLNV